MFVFGSSQTSYVELFWVVLGACLMVPPHLFYVEQLGA
jgi:hypothetical protein